MAHAEAEAEAAAAANLLGDWRAARVRGPLWRGGREAEAAEWDLSFARRLEEGWEERGEALPPLLDAFRFGADLLLGPSAAADAPDSRPLSSISLFTLLQTQSFTKKKKCIISRVFTSQYQCVSLASGFWLVPGEFGVFRLSLPLLDNACSPSLSFPCLTFVKIDN